VNILEAIDDPNVFGGHFREAESWRPWRAFLGALFGLPLASDSADLFRRSTGRSALPGTPFTEAWLVIGRRGGKSFIRAMQHCGTSAALRDRSRSSISALWRLTGRRVRHR
jgi:hypothetical protein